jgi:DNA-binding LacI/PurR family transcriptional regulator
MLDIINEEAVLPDLIIAEDDYVACGAISALHSHNIQINEKSKFLASGGFLKKLYPLNQCSSICLNHRELGKQAANLLIKYINGETIETETIYVPSSCIWV